ncbi:MAG: hypothetical protein DYG86_04050, partial [Chloroflexi bacterium CFX2]|nr:hypothetical protein [Chloroflexi bacterium CFX2]
MTEDDNDKLKRLLRSEDETRKDLDPAPPPGGTTASRKKTGNTTPILNLPDLDENNMPLPKRVDEVDVEGTRVTNAAYESAKETKPPRKAQVQNQRPAYRLPENQSPPRAHQNQYQRAPLSPTFADRMALFFGSIGSSLRGNKGCLVRVLVVSFFAIVILGLCAGSILVY